MNSLALEFETEEEIQLWLTSCGTSTGSQGNWKCSRRAQAAPTACTFYARSRSKKASWKNSRGNGSKSRAYGLPCVQRCPVGIIEQAKAKASEYYGPMESVVLANQEKVLKAFHAARVASHSFGESTGYAYSDQGREALEEVYRQVFRAEAALCRPQIVSGTHAISLCLSILEPGDELVSVSGPPYDTLQAVIGTRGASPRSLIKRGIIYKEVPLTREGSLDLAAISQQVTSSTKMAIFQRSRGYSWRRSLSIAHLAEGIKAVRSANPSCIIFVDNCYGEFVELLEPLEAGADLIAGSLIKNPGGTLAVSGGYIAGRRDLVNLCAEVLTAPSLGGKLGSTFGLTRSLLHGLFLAPHVVGEAIYGAVLVRLRCFRTQL